MLNGSTELIERLKSVRGVLNIFSQFRNAIRQINAKYAHPRIQMTPMVKTSLLMLRLYLILLIILLAYRFITLVR